MSFLQRVSIFSFIILLCASIYKDLSKDVHFLSESPAKHAVADSFNHYSMIKVKIESGDTVLSIIEHINRDHMEHFDMKQLMDDFSDLNPYVNPYDLDIGAYYYFPLYDH